MNINAIMHRLGDLWERALSIWIAGDWAMIAIAIVAFVMFAVGLNVQWKLRGKGFTSVPERTWRRWIDEPGLRRGPIGDLLDFVCGARTLRDIAIYFGELRTTEVAPFERDLRVMRTCVTAAPLLGLLGTVTGMLTTFGALASGAGGEKTMQQVADGISEALITTMTGLVIALPGLFFRYRLMRLHERYKAFVAHLETICTQKLYSKLRTDHANAPIARDEASQQPTRPLALAHA